MKICPLFFSYIKCISDWQSILLRPQCSAWCRPYFKVISTCTCITTCFTYVLELVSIQIALSIIYLFCLQVVIKHLVLIFTVLDQTLLVRQVCKYLVYISYCNQLYFQFQNSFIGEINVCLENFFQEFLICQGQTQLFSSSSS